MSVYNEITIKNGNSPHETVTFIPQEYQVSYDSLAAKNSGRNANGDMELSFILRKVVKLSIKLPAHKYNNPKISTILSLIQGQSFKVTFYDYLAHQTRTEDMYCSQTSAGYYFKGLIQDVGFELIGMSGATTVPHVNITPLTITWKDWNNTTLLTTQVISGDTPVYTGSTPTRAPTAQYTYTFSGWSPTPAPVSTNKTYMAQYSTTTNQYTVTATAGSHGSVTGSGTYNYGATATLVAIGDSGYTFSQWSDGSTSNPRYITVTGNVTLSCTFEEAPPTPTTWTITWYEDVSPSNEEDEDVPSENRYNVIGESINFPFTSNNSNYTSIGWDEHGEMFLYNGGTVWEGTGSARGWNVDNPNLRTITLTTDPTLIFVDQNWRQFVYHNSNWNPPM